MNFLLALNEFLRALLHLPEPEPVDRPFVPPVPSYTPKPIPMIPDPITPPIDTLWPWTTQKNYYHNVGVLCDLSGLTFAQKDVVRRCIFVESRFRDRYSDGTPVMNPNKDTTGAVWSRDWGLTQVNDWPAFKHIGAGCMFSSVEDVLSHPERSAQYMIDTMKNTGHLQPWASYTGGNYLNVPAASLDALKT